MWDAAFGGLCPTGELSRRLRQCILTLRRCFLSDSACQCTAAVAHKKNRVFVRITAIRRGVVISKHHSAPGERMLEACRHGLSSGQRSVLPAAGGSSAVCWRGCSCTCSTAAGITPVTDTALRGSGAGAGAAARVPASFCCQHPRCSGVYSVPRNFI